MLALAWLLYSFCYALLLDMDVRDTSAFSPVMRRARVLYQLAVDLDYFSVEEEDRLMRRYQEAMRDMPHLGFLDWAFIFNVLTPPQVDEVATLFEETALQCAECEEVFFGAHVDLMDDGLPCPNCHSGNVAVAQDISEWRQRVLPLSSPGHDSDSASISAAKTSPEGVPISPIPGRALADDPPPGRPDEPSFEDFAKGLEAGMRVGSCIVEEFVARGGMGMVYRGHLVEDESRTVALKVLHTRLTNNETLIARFREEARALSGLKSPHIVQVLEHGEVAKHGYLLMEWVEGESLAQRMHRLGTVGIHDALDAAEQTCRALEVAHAEGIIHRDVKPDNILLMPNGLVKLVDFGLSKNTRTDMRLSQAGTYVGTPAYLAPEQLGDTVTPLADVYGLACSLYHVLTGWLPFQGQDTAEVLQMHLQEPFPRASSLNPRVPEELDELLMRMGQKKPSRRPQSVGVVAAALKQLREELTAQPAAQRRPTRRGKRPPRANAADETAEVQVKPLAEGLDQQEEPAAAERAKPVKPATPPPPNTEEVSRKQSPPKPRPQAPSPRPTTPPTRPKSATTPPARPKSATTPPTRTGREPRHAGTAPIKRATTATKAQPRTKRSTPNRPPRGPSATRTTTTRRRRSNAQRNATTQATPASRVLLVAGAVAGLAVLIALIAWLT